MQTFDRGSGSHQDILRSALLSHSVAEGLHAAAEAKGCLLRFETGALMVLLGELERSLEVSPHNDGRIGLRQVGLKWGMGLGERLVDDRFSQPFRRLEIDISREEAQEHARDWLKGLCPGDTV